MSPTRFWDITAVSSLDKVILRFIRSGTEVEVTGMSEATRTMVDRFGIANDPAEIEKMLAGN